MNTPELLTCIYIKGLTVKYPHNELEAFGTGAMLDLRVRFAFELLKHSYMYSRIEPIEPKDAAVHALDTATALLELAEQRGLVTAYDDENTEPSDRIRAQAKRTSAFQVLQQLEGQKFAQNEATGISRVPFAPGFKQ